jgi:ubiquinone/menaquinone biosynthesis C-methylase UbiE
MKNICKICSQKIEPMGMSYRHESSLFSGLELEQCKNCDIVYATPDIDPICIKEYNSNYFHNSHGEEKVSKRIAAFYAAIANSRLHYISKNVALERFDSVLEIGPGNGYFAKKWIDRYGPSRYYAIETDSSCYKSLKNIGVKILDFDSPLNDQVSNIDLVIVSHVLEHIQKPLDFIAEIYTVARSGGMIFIEVPCLDYLYKKTYEPHIFFYQKTSLSSLLNICKFTVKDIGYYGETVADMNNRSLLKRAIDAANRLRARFYYCGQLFFGDTSIFSKKYEQIVAKNFMADDKQDSYSRWLRAIAKKE